MGSIAQIVSGALRQVGGRQRSRRWMKPDPFLHQSSADRPPMVRRGTAVIRVYLRSAAVPPYPAGIPAGPGLLARSQRFSSPVAPPAAHPVGGAALAAGIDRSRIPLDMGSIAPIGTNLPPPLGGGLG